MRLFVAWDAIVNATDWLRRKNQTFYRTSHSQMMLLLLMHSTRLHICISLFILLLNASLTYHFSWSSVLVAININLLFMYGSYIDSFSNFVYNRVANEANLKLFLCNINWTKMFIILVWIFLWPNDRQSIVFFVKTRYFQFKEVLHNNY